MKFISFGEVLLRIATPGSTTFAPTENGEIYFGGSELNVAIALKNLGITSDWVSILPKSDLGKIVLDLIKKSGIPDSHIKFGEGNMACYFVENGSGERPTKVLDRVSGPLGIDSRDGFDWNSILKGKSHFHTTGISSGLGDKVLSDVKEALETAKQLKLTTSYDFNFRGRLWTFDEAKKKQEALLKNIDILFGGIGDLEQMLGIKVSEEKTPSEYQKEIFKRFNFQEIVISERRNSSYRVFAATKDSVKTSSWKNLSGVDRIGTGDAMTAGYLYGIAKNKNLEEKVNLAALCGAIKDSIKGDFMNISENDLSRWFESQGHWR